MFEKLKKRLSKAETVQAPKDWVSDDKNKLVEVEIVRTSRPYPWGFKIRRSISGILFLANSFMAFVSFVNPSVDMLWKTFTVFWILNAWMSVYVYKEAKKA